ncbi:hypothetical protein MA03_03815 [Infirmifilum uzonense]|uniref:Uncharacterized protein n=1 Tax=Infirmifilum uzonense TaxID=1550241 RepID=A0A0F7CL08_9CREN|nr:hypothetical protein [Infirmifilum uzonense]AKG38586.1 hypothetical protein MA03_03815 [Infirmifilum uzonense]
MEGIISEFARRIRALYLLRGVAEALVYLALGLLMIVLLLTVLAFIHSFTEKALSFLHVARLLVEWP